MTKISALQSRLNNLQTEQQQLSQEISPTQKNIAANGQSQPLKPGMTLEADILQDSRKIWEWY